MNKRSRQWLGLAGVAALLGLILWRFTQSPDWRQFSWERVWSLLIHASPAWLGAAIVLSCASYLIRAYRWKFFLDPFKRSSVGVLFTGQIFGFSAVYLIGRPGELVRPAYIARWEGVPFASQLAILVLERLYDTVAVALLFGLALYLEPMPLGGARAVQTLHRMHEGAVGVLISTAGLVTALVLYRSYAEGLIAWAGTKLQFLPAKLRRGLGGVARSFAEGLDVIENWRDLTASVASTAILWVVNISVYWFVFQSLDGPLGKLSWWAATVVGFCAGVGLVFQLPGVGGGFQLAILFALKQVFQVPPDAATSAALLQWLVLLVPCVSLAVILLIYGGLSFKKLKAMAEAERESATREARAEDQVRKMMNAK
ncbi:MAG TPA: lysylphosphatidylglycerol synthase transmembrane domain-containing protein [Terriglobia bacterium]